MKPQQICEPAIEVAQHFSLEKPAFIIQEKGFITAKIYQINKGENLNILCLDAKKMGHPSSATHNSLSFGNSLSSGRKIVVLFTTKYAVPHQPQRQNSRVKHSKKAKKLKHCLYSLLAPEKKTVIVSFQ